MPARPSNNGGSCQLVTCWWCVVVSGRRRWCMTLVFHQATSEYPPQPLAAYHANVMQTEGAGIEPATRTPSTCCSTNRATLRRVGAGGVCVDQRQELPETSVDTDPNLLPIRTAPTCHATGRRRNRTAIQSGTWYQDHRREAQLSAARGREPHASHAVAQTG